LAQLILDAFVSNDFWGIVGNPAKFGLSLLAMGFDVLFLIQHYVLYRHDTEKSTEIERQPIIHSAEDDS